MVSSFGRGCCNQAATARGGRSQLPLHPDSKLIKRASWPCRARPRASSQLCQRLGKVAGEKVLRSWGNNPPPSLEANCPPLSLHPPSFAKCPPPAMPRPLPAASGWSLAGRACCFMDFLGTLLCLAKSTGSGQLQTLTGSGPFGTAAPRWYGSRPGKRCWDPVNSVCGDQEPARTWRDLGRDVLRVAVGKGDSGVLPGHWALHCKGTESWVPWWGEEGRGSSGEENKAHRKGRLVNKRLVFVFPPRPGTTVGKQGAEMVGFP